MHNSFGEGQGQGPPQAGPITPTRHNGSFLQNQTPSRDAFASITSPHNLRVLLKESELMKMTLQKDLAFAQEEIKLRNKHIASLQDEIKGLHARIAQQEITIRNQSKTIENPRTLRTGNSFVSPPKSLSQMSPHAPAFHMAAKTQQTLPSTMPLQQNQTGIPYHMNHNSVAHGSGQRGFDGSMTSASLKRLFEPIVPILDSNSPSMGIQEPSQKGVSDLTGVAANSPQISPYAGFEFETKATEFGARFRALWAKSDSFAKTYGMIVEDIHPNKLSAFLKDHMMIDSVENIAVQYLNNSVTRPLYVAKVINFYLCRKIMKYTEIVRGFDSNVDGEIVNVKKQITHDTPPLTRHSLLSKIAEQVTIAREKAKFKSFCQGARESNAYLLKTLLDPLLFVRGKGFAAHESLLEIIGDAQEIGLDLFSCPYSTRFHFPEISELYDPMCMENLDAGFGMAQVQNAKVKMSVTPFIRMGLNQSDPCRIRNVCNAKVFTSLPGGEEEPLGLTPGRMSKLG